MRIPRKFNIKKLLFYKSIKSFFDFLFATTFLLLGLPFFLLISLLIKFSSRGPIFYKQKRLGKNNTEFDCIKFRTMHPEAENMLITLLENDKRIKNEFYKDHKIKNDPRITNIGIFLRKTSLDELPQFINVIKGEMSIVGPRPIVKEEIEKYGKNFLQVFSVKPGITGLWQISGRNNLSYDRRVALDVIYSEDISLSLDLRIILRTFGVILLPKDKGAY